MSSESIGHGQPGLQSGRWRRTYVSIHCLWVLLFPVALGISDARGVDTGFKENEIRAAILYNFLLFVEWPAEVLEEGEITVGVIGNPELGAILERAERRGIGDKRLSVESLDEPPSRQALPRYHLLYFESAPGQSLMESLQEFPVLTVGRDAKFFELGGMILIFRDGARVRFDVHQSRIESTGIQVRSQMLRVARKVVKQ